ncbi:MAG: NADH-quinone oxidoreductase subunit L [Candidatus Binatia bacterium]|nr:NADH-quinone oxidoreductase subunit L [Candidatus Binatia bacterium]
METSLLRYIVLVPLLGFGLGALAANRDRPAIARMTGPGALILTFVLALFAVSRLWGLAPDGALVDNIYTWIEAGPLSIDLTFRVDRLTSVMILIITGVGSLIHIYSLGYMDDEPDVARYFAYLNLFVASMLILVLGDSLPVMFIGWEGVGLCSYLLIGFWYKEMPNADAGQKAMIVNRIGDAAFLIGMFLLFWSLNEIGTATLNLQGINEQAGDLAAKLPWVPTVACLLLLVGATGKSAQVPLYVWLPDAMAGPTPVSALIHAATMVTAGVYMIARLSFLYVEAPVAMEVVATIGGITCLFAATMAIVQEDLKKVLAYSTVSQIGYMIIGVGVGAFSAGIFHLMMHAFFKALLFLCAGAVMHALHGELRMSHMGGLKEKMPITARTFLIASLAIAGVPGFAAFFSKDMVLEAAFVNGHTFVWLLGTTAAGFTAFYVFRAYFRTFTGESRMDPEKAAHVHEMPKVMTVPLMILAVLSTIGGYIGMPFHLLWGDAIGEYLAPSLAQIEHHGNPSTGTLLMLMASATGAALFGIWWAHTLYVRSPETLDKVYAKTTRIYEVLFNKYWIDELYDSLIIDPYKRASRFFWKTVDSVVIDGVVNGVGAVVVWNSGVLRRLQTGNVQSYALGMLLGAVAIVGGYWLFVGVG